MNEDLPIIVPRKLNPLNQTTEWLVYDKQRPIGSDICVTSGFTIEEAKEKYTKYRNYEGKFLIQIGGGEEADLIEGATYDDLRKRCETDE